MMVEVTAAAPPSVSALQPSHSTSGSCSETQQSASTSTEDHSHHHASDSVGSAKEMLAGGIAGITEHAVMFPFDTIKTKIQQEGSNFKSTTQCFKHVVTHEKWTHLYRGCAPIVCSAFPAHGAYFACYEGTKRTIGANSSWGYAAAAVAATMAHDFCSVPFDAIKQRMQVDTTHPSSLSCLRSVIAKDGVGKLFHSYPVTVAMNIPHIVTQWVVYEAIKARLESRGLLENDWSPSYLFAGFVAGGCAAAASTPFDVVKTRVQLSPTPKSALSAATDVLAKEGPWGFLRGGIPRIMCIAPSAAIVLTTYEICKNVLALPPDSKPMG